MTEGPLQQLEHFILSRFLAGTVEVNAHRCKRVAHRPGRFHRDDGRLPDDLVEPNDGL
jgi:hypothetical protein